MAPVVARLDAVRTSIANIDIQTRIASLKERLIRAGHFDFLRSSLTRFVLLFTAAFLSVFFCLLGAKVYSDYQLTLARAEIEADGISTLVAREINVLIEDAFQASEFLVKSAPWLPEAELYDLIRTPGASSSAIRHFYIVEPDSFSLLDNEVKIDRQEQAGLAEAGRIWQQSEHTSNDFILPTKLNLTIIRLLPPSSSAQERMLVVQIDHSEFRKTLAHSGVSAFLGANGIIAILDKSSQLVTSTLYPRVTNFTDNKFKKDILAVVPFEKGLRYIDSQSGTVLTSIRSIGDSQRLLAVAVSTNQILSPWRRSLPLFLAFALSTFLFALAFASFISRQIREVRAANQLLRQSEQLFELAAASANCGIWDWDIHSGQMFWSRSIPEFLGQDARPMVLPFQNMLELVHPSDRKYVKRIEANVLDGQLSYDTKFRLKHENGRYIWVRAKGELREDNSAGEGINNLKSQHIIGVVSDITDELVAEARAQEAEARLQKAIEGSSDAFALWDRFGKPIATNSKYRDKARFDLPIARQALTKTVEVELPDGFWVQVKSYPLEGGGVVSIGRDITDLKGKNAALLESKKELKATIEDLETSRTHLTVLAEKFAEEKQKAEEANRSKTEFLANMSHELRTPLNAIIGFSEVMQTGIFGSLGDERYVGYAKDIHSSGRNLLELIDDILDMSRLEAGKFEIDPQPLELPKVIQECLRIMEPKAFEEKIKIHVEIGNIPEAFADKRATKQIITNLVGNAIKFTPANGNVWIRAKANLQEVLISVEDEGIGIADEDLPKIGNAFVQIESQHSRRFTGSGLGLAISRSLIEMHHGKFQIESTLGQGTKVSFSLPRREDGIQSAVSF